MLKRKELTIIITVAVVMFIGVKLLPNFMPFGSEQTINFCFSQMAFIQVLFAYCLFRLMKSWITFFWMLYVAGELINEVFFKGNIDYIGITLGALSLFYYYYKNGKRKHR